jgi:hypothetical protein
VSDTWPRLRTAGATAHQGAMTWPTTRGPFAASIHLNPLVERFRRTRDGRA